MSTITNTEMPIAASISGAVADAVGSMVHELVALFIFFITWVVINHMRSKKAAPVTKGTNRSQKRNQSTQEVAEAIVNLCQEQFTRALRLYRDLIKTGRDTEIVDEVFYTSLVEAAIRVGKADVAEQIITRMHTNGMVPSVAFLQSLLKLFAARKNFAECIRAYELFEPKPDKVIYSCLTLAAAETADVPLCREFLNRAAQHFPLAGRDVLPLLRLFTRRRDYEAAAAELRVLFQKEWELESIVVNTVLGVCVHAPDMELMEAIVRETREYEIKTKTSLLDIVSYNTLMKSAARRGDVPKCFSILDQIQELELVADDVTFSTLLDVCIDREEHERASVALERMCDSGVTMNCVLLTTLMKGFIRSKHLDKAMALFDTMRSTESQVKPDMITYSMLIKAQCDVGDMGQALQILEDMLQNSCDVDDVVFTHLIEGCCHVANLQLAEKLFRDMRSANIKPSVYTMTAMVKVYGKCGQTDHSWDLVRTMKEKYDLEPTCIMYTCLISSMLRQNKPADAYEAFRYMCDRVAPDAQCVQTVMSGLVEAKMWREFLDLVGDSMRHKPPLRLKDDTVNQGLIGMFQAGEQGAVESLLAVMAISRIEVSSKAKRMMST